MATQIWAKIGSGNVSLADDTEPLPEPILTFHQRGFVTFSALRMIVANAMNPSII